MAALVILTPGLQLFLAANNAIVTRAAPSTLRGMASGLLGLSRNLGPLIGASGMMTLFGALVGTEHIDAAPVANIGPAFTAVFLLSAGLAIVAAGLSLHGKADDPGP